MMYRDYDPPAYLDHVGSSIQRAWSELAFDQKLFLHFVYQRGGVLDLELMASWFNISTRHALNRSKELDPSWIKPWPRNSRPKGGFYPKIFSLNARTLRVFMDPNSNIRRLKDHWKALGYLARAHFVLADKESEFCNMQNKAEAITAAAPESVWPIFRVRRHLGRKRALALNVEITKEKDTYGILFCPPDHEQLAYDLNRWAPFIKHTGWHQKVLAFTSSIQKAAMKWKDSPPSQVMIKSSRDKLKELVYGPDSLKLNAKRDFEIVPFMDVHLNHY